MDQLPPLGAKNCDLGSYRADELRCGDFSRRHGTLCGTAGQRGGAGESSADAGNVVGTESTTGTVRAEKKSVIDTFFDINYPDERIEKVWPNMKVEVQ